MTTGFNTFKAVAIAGLSASCLAVMVSCTKSSSISATGDASVGGAGSLAISLVFPSLSGSSWTPITLAGRYYIKGTRITVTGTCARGIGTIRVNEGGPDYAEEATCSGAGTFAWTKIDYVGQSDKTLTFTAYDVSDTLLAGVTATVNVRMDNVAPGVAVVTDPAASPFQYTGAASTYNIVGTNDADVAYITTDGGVNITPVGLNWNYTVNLTQGATLNYNFYATDLAGNAAALTLQQIAFNPQIDVQFASYHGGGVVPGTSSFELDSTLAWDSGTQVSIDGSLFNLDTGFNFVTEQSRSTVSPAY